MGALAYAARVTRRIALFLAPLVFAAALTGCFGNETTEFPEGLEPLGDNEAPPIPPGAGDAFPEVIVFAEGSRDGFDWVHARAYVKGDATAVWDIIKEPEVVANRRETDSQTFTFGVEPQYEHSFAIDYLVKDFIDVDWTENWRYQTVEGSPDDVDLSFIRYQKTFGTVFINLLEGSIAVYRVEDGVSEIEFVEHLDAAMSSVDDMKQTVEDRIANIRARLAGQPLPEL